MKLVMRLHAPNLNRLPLLRLHPRMERCCDGFSLLISGYLEGTFRRRLPSTEKITLSATVVWQELSKSVVVANQFEGRDFLFAEHFSYYGNH